MRGTRRRVGRSSRSVRPPARSPARCRAATAARAAAGEGRQGARPGLRSDSTSRRLGCCRAPSSPPVPGPPPPAPSLPPRPLPLACLPPSLPPSSFLRQQKAESHSGARPWGAEPPPPPSFPGKGLGGMSRESRVPSLQSREQLSRRRLGRRRLLLLRRRQPGA